MSATNSHALIRAVVDDRVGSMGWRFAVESCKASDPDLTIISIEQFSHLIENGMSYYGNKGGIEASSLFKSYVGECFEELAQERPEMASCLTGLVVLCDALPSALKSSSAWRLQRAILAALPGISFIE